MGVVASRQYFVFTRCYTPPRFVFGWLLRSSNIKVIIWSGPPLHPGLFWAGHHIKTGKSGLYGPEQESRLKLATIGIKILTILTSTNDKGALQLQGDN